METADFLPMIVNFVALIFAITTHESAHGAMALVFGDDTAKRLGRITLNPLKHIDPVGSVLLPGILLLTQASVFFGWAKPVPVNFYALHPKRLGVFMVALAGPASNLAIAWVSALLLHVAGKENMLSELLGNMIQYNLILAVFNLIPLLPLDGGRILGALLPQRLAEPYARLERYGFAVLMAVLFLPSLLGKPGVLWVILKPLYTLFLFIILRLSGH